MSYDYLTLNYRGGPPTELLGINNDGTLAGFSNAPGAGVSDATGFVVLSPYSVFTLQNIPAASGTGVFGVNNLGATVGAYSDASNNTLGYIDVGGTVTTVVNPSTPTSRLGFNELLGINDFGVAVGEYQDAAENLQSYTYNMATQAFTAIAAAGASSTVATGINNAGVICGYDTIGTSVQGFIDVNGQFTQLSGPAGSVVTQALGLNNQGLVVGDYTDTAGSTHGFVYNIATAAYTTIDAPGVATSGPTFTVVNGLNDQGQIVGYYKGSIGVGDQGFFATLQGTIQTVTDPVAGSTLRVGPGSGGVAAGGSNAVTLVDQYVGNAKLFANSGNDTLVTGANDMLVGGSGNDTFFTGIEPAAVFLGSGHNTVVANDSVGPGATTVVASTGTDVVYAGTGTTVFGGAAGNALTAVGSGTATVVDGAGQLTAFEGAASGGAVYGGAGATTYVGGSGNNTFVGGSGAAVAYAGTGSDVLYGGSGPDTFVGAANADTTIVAGIGPASVYYGNGNKVFLSGSANHVAEHYGATGALSDIVATGSSGSDLFVLGVGSNALYEGAGRTTTFLGSGVSDITGGGGADLYVSVNGQSGGVDLLRDFRIGTDLVQLSGYGANEVQNDLAHARVSGGSTIVTLSDNTSLDFVGVTGLSAHSFVT